MTHDQFQVGMRIKQKLDEGDGPQWFYGHVKEVHPDRIVIKWPDIDEPIAHYQDEWDSIKVGNPGVE